MYVQLSLCSHDLERVVSVSSHGYTTVEATEEEEEVVATYEKEGTARTTRSGCSERCALALGTQGNDPIRQPTRRVISDTQRGEDQTHEAAVRYPRTRRAPLHEACVMDRADDARTHAPSRQQQGTSYWQERHEHDGQSFSGENDTLISPSLPIGALVVMVMVKYRFGPMIMHTVIANAECCVTFIFLQMVV